MNNSVFPIECKLKTLFREAQFVFNYFKKLRTFMDFKTYIQPNITDDLKKFEAEIDSLLDFRRPSHRSRKQT